MIRKYVLPCLPFAHPRDVAFTNATSSICDMQPLPGEKQGFQQEFQIEEKAPPPAFVVARSSLRRPQGRETILFAAFGRHESFVVDLRCRCLEMV